MTLNPTTTQVDEKIQSLISGTNQTNVFKQLNEDERKHVFWALETGQANGNLPEIFIEGISAVRSKITAWKPINTAKKNELDKTEKDGAVLRQKEEDQFQTSVMKLQLNRFIKMLAAKGFKLSINPTMKIELVFDKIAEHHLGLSEKILNPLLAAQGITDQVSIASIRSLSWEILYRKQFFGMPKFSVSNESTIESSIALLAAITYQTTILGNPGSRTDSQIEKFLENSKDTIAMDYAKEQEELDGLSPEESNGMFAKFLPRTFEKIKESIAAKISGL